jgi:acyl-CoA hydrolase
MAEKQPVDLTRWIKSGDVVWWGHGTSEPLALTEALVAQRAAIGQFSVFVGPTFSSTILPKHADHVTFSSYCAIGANQALFAAGALDVVPCHVSEVCSLLDDGILRCDVVLMQLGRAGPDGKNKVAVSHDYLIHAAKRARVIIAEINEAAPWTYGAEEFDELRVDHTVLVNHPVLTVAPKKATAVENKVAENVAEIIPDRAALQTGIGTIPDAVLYALRGHRDLGVHSGMIGDRVVDLIESGAVTNAFKSIDPGVTVTGMLAGTERLYEFADHNPRIVLRPLTHTHAVSVTSRIERFFAINSAIEIDLSGQINAEMIGHDYVGAIGGQVDFSRGAIASKGGRSIVALPSTAANGKRSRIVANLSAGVVTTARSDTDLVVTEWGVADLRGQSLRERSRRLIAIAHPDFREMLEKATWPAH